MTDIFFSYRSSDRDRVRPVRDAFAGFGFDVFWDQQVPAGVDWDTWIRRHLAQAKCAIVFWSASSVNSDNVRHEAAVAKQQNKLIPVLLEQLTVEQFPIGLYAQQAANLIGWGGDFDNAEWRKLRREVEAKLTPAWVRDRIDELEAEFVAERSRREAAERRDKIWQAQIDKEVQRQEDLKREHDKAAEEAAGLGIAVQELRRALSESDDLKSELLRRAQDAQNEVKALQKQIKALEWQRDGAVGRAVESERKLRDIQNQRLALVKAENCDTRPTSHGTRATGLRTGVETLLKALRARLHGRRGIYGTVAVLTLIFAGLAASVSQLGLDARRGSLGKFDRNPTLPSATDQLAATAPGATSDANPASRAFTVSQGMEANGTVSESPFYTPSISDCQDRCARMAACGVFSYSKISKKCYLYRAATLSRNEYFDTGTLAKAAGQRAQPDPGVENDPETVAGAFAIVQGMRADGTELTGGISYDSSPVDCEGRCTRTPACGTFSYSELSRYCYLYGTATLKKSDSFVSGTRKYSQSSKTSELGPSTLFTITPNMEVIGVPNGGLKAESAADCQQECSTSAACSLYDFNKKLRRCSFYTSGELRASDLFDAGIRTVRTIRSEQQKK